MSEQPKAAKLSKRALGVKLARTLAKRVELEGEAKEAAAKFKARKAKLDAEIQRLTGLLTGRLGVQLDLTDLTRPTPACPEGHLITAGRCVRCGLAEVDLVRGTQFETGRQP